MPRGYSDDLSHIHDVGFGWFSDNSGPQLLAMLGELGIKTGCVLDLGCGSGIWARQLVDAGYDVTGIDISRGMLDIARKRVPEATFQCASYLDAELPECDVVTALGECFNYRFDERVGQRVLGRIFRKVHDALAPGGLFVFDVATPGRGGGPTKRVRNWEGDDWALMLRVEEDTARRRLERHMTSFRKVGKHYRRHSETHVLRLYRASDVAQALRQAGFRVRIVRGYGSYAFVPGHSGFIARAGR